MPSELERQHRAHKERMRRFYPPEPKPVLVAVESIPPEPEPEPEPKQDPPKLNFPINQVTQIARTCAHYFDCSYPELLSHRRTKDIVRVRQVAMFLARSANKGLTEIGAKIGGRDHTTVLHGIRTIDRLVKSDWTIAFDVAAIEIKLENLAKKT